MAYWSQFLNSPFIINKESTLHSRGFGGVRIEEDVAITSDGCEVLSKVPRTVDEIETWMSGNDEVTFLKYFDPLNTHFRSETVFIQLMFLQDSLDPLKED